MPHPRIPRTGLPALIAAGLLLPASIRDLEAQTIPYEVPHAVFEAARKINSIDGIRIDIRMTHSGENDRRPFEVFIETPTGRQKIDVKPDGSFNLPEIPADQHAASVVRHSLEKGALRFSFAFEFYVKMDLTGNATIADFTNPLAGRFKLIDPRMWRQLGTVAPELRNPRISATGLVLETSEPMAGKILLKKGETVKMTIDLAKPGVARIPFSEFNPQEHTVHGEGLSEDLELQLRYDFVFGEAAERARNAIKFVWIDP